MQTISDINIETPEGKLLMAAIAVITTESRTTSEPDTVLKHIEWLSEFMHSKKDNINKEEHEKRRVLPGFNPVEFGIKSISQAIAIDRGYREGWRANLAMAFYDEITEHNLKCIDLDIISDPDAHKIANDAAKNFIDTHLTKI